MSFINSVLGSIGSGKNQQGPSVAPQATTPQYSESRPGDAGQRDAKAMEQQLAQSGKKRKPEDTLGRRAEKIARSIHNAAPNAGTGRSPFSNAPAANLKSATVVQTGSSSADVDKNRLQLTSKASNPKASIASPHMPKPDSEPVPTKKPPKKGSYAEIMARAKAKPQTQAVGTIVHKPKEKGPISYKKEMKLQKQAMRDKKLGKVREKDGYRISSSGEAVELGTEARKKKSEPALPPKKPKPQPAYKGTMNPASVTAKAKEKAAAQSARRGNEYAGTDEELDEEGDDDIDEDGYGYDDEESDDMEAGFSDVEQEESEAAMAARMEDEAEARLEARLKREKEERKRNMDALAKRAKPPKY